MIIILLMGKSVKGKCLMKIIVSLNRSGAFWSVFSYDYARIGLLCVFDDLFPEKMRENVVFLSFFNEMEFVKVICVDFSSSFCAILRSPLRTSSLEVIDCPTFPSLYVYAYPSFHFSPFSLFSHSFISLPSSLSHLRYPSLRPSPLPPPYLPNDAGFPSSLKVSPLSPL